MTKKILIQDILLRMTKNPSGVALINVDENGENSIVVASGSNGHLSAYDINDEVFNTDKIRYFPYAA